MKTWTLRAKLTAWSALATGLALFALAATTTISLYFSEVESVDEHLAADASLFFAALPSKPGESGGPAGADLLRKHNEVLHGFAIGPIKGRPVQIYPDNVASLVAEWPPRGGARMMKFKDRTVRIAVFMKDDRALLLVGDLEAVRETLGRLLSAYALALPILLIVVAAGSRWIARSALQPIAEITHAAASITTARLGDRLPAVQTADEIGRHTEVLNGMFDRLQRGFEQATRFTADAAHELRTPLTIMRGQIEEALRSGRFNTEQEAVLVGLLEETSGLQKISENLLLLARFDTGKGALQREPVDFSALLADIVEDAELLAAPRGLKVSAELVPALRVDADPVMLRRLALNLLDNAVKFNRPAGEVKLALRADGDHAVVMTIGNTGPGIPSDRREALFERFYRSASSRNRDSGGSGLGLSLCREIAVAHGGQIELSRSDEQWTEFSVRLLRLPAAS